MQSKAVVVRSGREYVLKESREKEGRDKGKWTYQDDMPPGRNSILPSDPTANTSWSHYFSSPYASLLSEYPHQQT
jgi:hypothetical protein